MRVCERESRAELEEEAAGERDLLSFPSLLSSAWNSRSYNVRCSSLLLGPSPDSPAAQPHQRDFKRAPVRRTRRAQSLPLAVTQHSSAQDVQRGARVAVDAGTVEWADSGHSGAGEEGGRLGYSSSAEHHPPHLAHSATAQAS